MESREHPSLQGMPPGPESAEPRDRLGTRERVVLGFFAVAAAYFLWTEHLAHVIQFLPWGILALCLLMHLFMHRGHGGHGGHGSHDSGPDTGGGGRER